MWELGRTGERRVEKVGRCREGRHSLIRSATKARRLLLALLRCSAVTFST